MKVQTLAHALQKLPKDSELGKMINKVVISKRVVRKHKTRIKATVSKSKQFKNSIRKTAYLGIGSLSPCSLLSWRPGRPVLADGKPGRIKWGLTDGRLEFVVVLYDYPQPIHGTTDTTEYGLISVSHLDRCDCAGYMHKKHCSNT